MNVSAIIPTYNRAHCVGDAIESVLQQTRACGETIVVDDGSTDQTPAVLAGFGDRIRVIRQVNAGVSAARNAGVIAARGEWVAFLDSDDLWTPGKIEAQCEAVTQNPAAVAIFCDVRLHMAQGQWADWFEHRGVFRVSSPVLIERPVQTVLQWLCFPQTFMARRSDVIAAGLFNPRFRTFEDMDFLLRLADRGPWIVCPEPLVQVRRMEGEGLSVSAAMDRWPLHSLRVRLHCCRSALRRAPRSKAEARMLRKHIAMNLSDYANIVGSRAGSRRATRLYWHALQQRPRPKALARWVLSAGFGKRGSIIIQRLLTRSTKAIRPLEPVSTGATGDTDPRSVAD